jgi:pimeloyl-ACP methyl ester carboxylesterase
LSTYQSGRRILDWPADVAALVDALGYGGTAFGVMGMSGGAAYALATLSAMPDRVTHAALVSGQAPPDSGATGSQTRTLQAVNRRPRIMTIAINAVARRLDRNADAVAQNISEHWAAVDRRLIFCNREYYASYIDTLRQSVRCGTAGVIREAQLLGQRWGFRVCDVPPNVSIWQGGCDPIAPPAMGHWFHRQIAGSELILDPSAGHLTMLKVHAADILARFP